jgi:hypothetical protein
MCLVLVGDVERPELGRLQRRVELVVVRPAAGARVVPVSAQFHGHRSADAPGVDAVLEGERRDYREGIGHLVS